MSDKIESPVTYPQSVVLELRAENERLQHAVNGLSGELEELRSLVLDWHQAVTPGERMDAIQALTDVAERLRPT